MGVPDNSLLDLLEKVRSWIYWGTGDIYPVSGEVNMADCGQTMCCECEMRISESCLGYSCGRCSRLFCESCVQGYASFIVVESKSGNQAGVDIRCCKFCANFEKIGGKFSHKIYPSDSPGQSPEPREKFDRSSLKAVYVRHSTGRSDEDEAEDSCRNMFSLDIDSSSRHEFMSLGSSPCDSPFRTHLTTPRPDDHGTPRSLTFDPEPVLASPPENNDLREPLDLENIWFPLPPEDDEDTSFFSYADDDDEMGPPGAFFSYTDNLVSENVEPLENLVQGHFRALVSHLLQSESMEADHWLDIITSLAWQAANFVKPDTSKGGSMDPGDYVKIKCLASGNPNQSMFVKGVVCTKNIKHKRMSSQYKNPRLLILGGALEYQRAHNQLASIETLLQQEIDHLKMIVSRIESRRPNVLLVEKSVSPYAQEYLLAKDISLVSNIKRPLLERIARCTGAPITPNTDQISTTRLGQCESFRLEKISQEAATKKPSKTLMFFDGCPRRLGCTVLLKGSCWEELKKVKHVVQYAVFAAYHLSLETSFLADEGATLPKMTINPPIDVAVDSKDTDASDECWAEEMISTEQEIMDGTNEYYSSTETNQSILVSFSSRCVLNGNVCERSRLLRIKFYGCFDKPLGRYLQDDLFDQTSWCGACNEAAEGHVICYSHQQGNLTINVKRIPSLNLAGGKIWMWHRCMKCAHVDGVPPATRRVVMSDAAWGLSFGKFLELSFSNHATANRVAGCGHSLQRDCLRFYGLGSMVVFFQYSPIDILSVRLPPSVLEFSGHVQQAWLKKEVAELLNKTKMLYDEIFEVLNRTEHKSFNISSSDELNKHIQELKDMLIKERNVYIDLLGVAEIDVFELNRLRHSLTIGLHAWDRRLNSIFKQNPNVEVKHRRSYSTIVDHSQTVNDSTQFESKEEVDLSPISCDASFLSDKIDSAWTGLMTRPENPNFRRLASTPARVYSFDSAMSLQERIKNHMVKDPICNLHRSYSQVFPCEDQKLEFLSKTKPSFLSPTSFVPDGARLMGGHNAVIAVYENDLTSIISYALASKEYEEWFTHKPCLNRNHSVATSKLSAWQSFASNDFDEDPSTTLFSESKSCHHLTIPFEDGGKVKFSVMCYFAKQFDNLRKKCCRSEVDYMRSLSRCRRWSAQGGKSGAYFAKSLDERFIIKGVTKTELESFEEFAPQYFKYLTESLNSGSPTCLAKIVGIYQVSVRGGKMHVMVMENLFFKRSICRVYDLKGSARSRYNSEKRGTLLDMNLLEANPMFLGSKAKRNLERAVWNDTSFLASIDVMDYSLLVGVDEESKELVVGIIDFMRQYTWDKQLETWVKASGILGGPKNTSPTIISPKQYKRRFRKAITTYFLTLPDQWSF